MKKLAIFDMAGTTVNDRDEVYRVLREATEREGAIYSDDEFQEFMGTEKKYAIGRLLSLGGVEPETEVVERAWEWFRAELRRTYESNPPAALPGVEGALAQLRDSGIKVALTTGFSREITNIILAGLGWDTGEIIDAVAAGDEVESGRPQPDLIRRVMELTGVDDLGQVISTGDTSADIQSARNAGVTSVGVLTGHLTREQFEREGADIVINSVADFPNVDILR
ncbi:phosphonatase-like hydrolase [Corynebacterium liangguodongii]|uniref:Phosphonatase-like hydrolase n=1 Tax=Corynebacterium liangguodongii TaxID=2079535 RepID=A0A2S0WFB8_9CORY|nr:phosphonatase-like hydrolase [Corynebacterium liangguodongii]AWB84483.1 phosphonatase-like hydrolase [Corynebacterium liangguodongii]PWB98701.1 phosphonatase-like hydrolase [Corynebacterium liangguodongii]